MINPDSSRTMNCNAVIINDIVDIQVSNYHIIRSLDSDTCTSDGCTIAIANKALVGANFEARRKIKVSLDDNGERVIALPESDITAKKIGASWGALLPGQRLRAHQLL